MYVLTKKVYIAFYQLSGSHSARFDKINLIKIPKRVVRETTNITFGTCPRFAVDGILYVSGYKPIATFNNANWLHHEFL